ncbi:MAG: T9SS type A sorting domain-containing protein [Melioribacteraceae bacterium]|nr:T9SS type A sorting domain-containing protein [Melioribacteraceae bacterium]
MVYDPTYEISVDNWLDGVDFLGDVEVDMTGIGIDEAEYNIGGHRTLAAGNKIVFLSFDPLSLDAYPHTEYWWWGIMNSAPQTQALYWFDAVVIGVDDKTTLPESYSLAQNYPNPFNPTTMITYAIPEKANVTLTVYNLLGQEVATLVNEVKNVGTYEVNFKANQLTTGVYFYTIQAGQFTSTKKMMLIK